MQVTEEQRRRAEANRVAALERRKRAAERPPDPHSWKLARCRTFPSPAAAPPAEALLELDPRLPSPFRAVLEICSPDEFSVTPEPLQGSWFPGEAECLQAIEACVSSVLPFCPMISQGGRRTSVFKIAEYEMVLRCLKKLAVVELQEIPYTTRLVVEKFSQNVDSHWVPFMEEHYSDEQVDKLMEKLPKSLRDVLLPYQLEGVRFGLRRGGRCLIADEMGLGKTIQAISIAYCFSDEGPILIVCPAVLRFSWAEELEHWLPTLVPKDIHLVFGHQDNLDCLRRDPKVVVISYTMLNRLRKSMLERNWALMIVDESHNIRCTKKQSESEEKKAVIELAAKIKRIVLLSGTPSLSRPGLLGKNKYDFAKNYCLMKLVQRAQGVTFKDFSKGNRLGELNLLLRQTVMIRRLKEHVLTQLPPKRRQIIRVMLKADDILLAKRSCGESGKIPGDLEPHKESMVECSSDQSNEEEKKMENSDGCQENFPKETQKKLSNQEIGIAKLSGFREWFSNHYALELEDAVSSQMGLDSKKTIIFAHHIKVLDGVQEFVFEKGMKFVRIDGSTLPIDRKRAVEAFRYSKEVKIAIIGITVGGYGLDLSSAENVVFLELPETSAEMVQAEDRAHRRGQTKAVNIYIFCAMNTLDESRWRRLNKSLFCVSSMTNGKRDAIKEIEVDTVIQLEYSENLLRDVSCLSTPTNDLIDGCSEKDKAGKVDSVTLEQNSQAVGIHGDSCGEDENVTVRQYSEADNDSESGIEEGCLVPNTQISDSRAKEVENSTIVCIWKPNKGNEEFISSESKTAKADRIYPGVPSCDVRDGAHEPSDAGANDQIQADSLRFEVSQYTGRVHLYICIPGKDSRPRPLFENFRPEELDSVVFSDGNMCKESCPHMWKDPVYSTILKTFIQEWNALRPIEQHKLLGKPLQLPLSSELLYLKESINHGRAGLLRGGSSRRVTPITDFSYPLPENAIWRNITLHGGTTKEKVYFQACIGDIPLCKLCQQPCSGKLAKAPEYFEDLFCNLSCFQEYRIRTSQRALREALFQIEHGVCTQCKLDCHGLVKCIKRLSTARRREYIQKIAPRLAEKSKILEKLVNEPIEGNAWHADHIVPVHKGGGECRLENMRTLCVVCHLEVTKAQRTELCIARMKAKERLKIAMKMLKDTRIFSSSSDVDGQDCDGGEPAEEKLLFIKVPGSSYSRNETIMSDDHDSEISSNQ